ncbi:hypothetical protein DsansV1_C25g0185771 [Dioscorea sansibarensis]
MDSKGFTDDNGEQTWLRLGGFLVSRLLPLCSPGGFRIAEEKEKGEGAANRGVVAVDLSRLQALESFSKVSR